MSLRLESEDGTSVTIHRGRLVRSVRWPRATFSLGVGSLYPGLINAHDHLHRNHYPRLGTPPYPNSYVWGRDLHTRFQEELARAATLPRRDALLFGALKNLIAGVTTVAHHDRWESAFDRDFPIRLAPARIAHSLRLFPRLHDVARRSARARRLPLHVHLAEGTDAVAAAEVGAGARWLDGDLLAVHAVGVGPPEIELLLKAHVAVVWCPTSNLFLFGQTAPQELITADIDVLLGTDALLTGEGTLLDELRVARRLRYLDDARLLAAVGRTAAVRLGVPLPSLALTARADVALFRRPLLEAAVGDVGLVVVAGRPHYGDAEFSDLFAWSGVPVEPLVVGGVERLVAAPLASVAARVAELFQEPLRILA